MHVCWRMPPGNQWRIEPADDEYLNPRTGLLWKPTHWMPLPPPPTTVEKDDHAEVCFSPKAVAPLPGGDVATIARRIREYQRKFPGSDLECAVDAALHPNAPDAPSPQGDGCYCDNYETPGKIDPLCPIHAPQGDVGDEQRHQLKREVYTGLGRYPHLDPGPYHPSPQGEPSCDLTTGFPRWCRNHLSWECTKTSPQGDVGEPSEAEMLADDTPGSLGTYMRVMSEREPHTDIAGVKAALHKAIDSHKPDSDAGECCYAPLVCIDPKDLAEALRTIEGLERELHAERLRADCNHDQAGDYYSELTEAQATCERLRAALEPFAAEADKADGQIARADLGGATGGWDAKISLGQCRAARAALAPGRTG